LEGLSKKIHSTLRKKIITGWVKSFVVTILNLIHLCDLKIGIKTGIGVFGPPGRVHVLILYFVGGARLVDAICNYSGGHHIAVTPRPQKLS
jgi:hypothetical protein